VFSSLVDGVRLG